VTEPKVVVAHREHLWWLLAEAAQLEHMIMCQYGRRRRRKSKAPPSLDVVGFVHGEWLPPGLIDTP
jgi:hypothetical protein